jgi:Arm DNA-binding domain/Phage integrase, N-terminal SAM-like domain
LHVLIIPNGSKYFRFKYRFAGKEKTLALGVYPETTLKLAREKRDLARKQIADGIDPSESRKADKIAKAHTFEQVTRDWLKSINHTVRDITHEKKLRRFERHVFPIIGDKAIGDIKSPDIFSLVKPLFAKLETAHRVHSEISAVFGYAIAHGFTD